MKIIPKYRRCVEQGELQMSTGKNVLSGRIFVLNGNVSFYRQVEFLIGACESRNDAPRFRKKSYRNFALTVSDCLRNGD
jgi:hypothetical protein